MSLEDLMQSLKAEYLAELPAKIQNIAAHCSESSLPLLREDFHKLKGTGKTYGIPELSQLAEVMEQMVIKQPKRALMNQTIFLELLHEIHQARTQNQETILDTDKRFQSLL